MRKYLLATLAACTLSLSAHAELVANFTFDGTTVDTVSGAEATIKQLNSNTDGFVTDRHGQTQSAMSLRDTTLLFSQTNAPTLTQYTVSTWFKFDDNASAQGRQYLFDSRNSSSLLLFYDFGNHNGFGITSNSIDGGDQYLDDGQWHYVALSGDTQGTRLYVDGQMIGSTTLNTSLSINRLTIGNYKNYSSTYDFRGAVDDFQVHDVSMDAQTINQQYFLQSQPSDVGIPLYGMSALLLGGLMLRSRKPQN